MFWKPTRRQLVCSGAMGDMGLTLTSTCSAVQVSMVKDLTLEICVPNFRCSAAQRMQRKMPICQRGQYVQASDQCQCLTFQLPHPIKKLVCDSSMESGGQTWGRGIAIGTSVVTRNGPDEFRKGLFIPRLLALAETGWHNACTIYNYKNIEKRKRKGVATNPNKMRE